MNKTKIKNFSIWARRNLIDAVAYHMRLLGIDEKGIRPEMEGSSDKLKLYDMGTSKPAEVDDQKISKRDHLARHIQDHQKKSDYKTAYETVVEEIAYTWFNRLIAIRFMEVNDYLPSGVRVLSSTSGKPEPDIVTQAEEVASEQGFNISKEEIWKLKDGNNLDELFRILFIAQCRKLHEILPELFDNSQSDFTELLLPISFIDNDGFIRRLVTDIDEGDFAIAKNGQVEIIGWLYQYYNTEPKAKIEKKLKTTEEKVKKEELGAKTQIFTPDWIVRYMVENSLGRLWLNGHANSSAKTEWKYYLEEANQTLEVQAQLAEIREGHKNLSPEQIRFIDPCMGSGHILVYAFDVLMQIYLSCGYTEREAAHSIARNNLWGLDLDKRAYQLAYFAVMMKVRQYDRRLWYRITELKTFDAHLPNLSHFQDLPNPNYASLDEPISSFAMQFENADNYGSLISVQAVDGIDAAIDKFQMSVDFSFMQFEHMMKLYKILSQRYDVVCTNPPYMAIKYANTTLKDFVNDHYIGGKTDLFACFVEKCFSFAKGQGMFSMITSHSWMFLSSFNKLRDKMILKTTINMTHLGARAFDEISGEVVQTTAFINYNFLIPNYNGRYVRLVGFDSENTKREAFFSKANRYATNQESFTCIPHNPYAYWISSNATQWFTREKNLGSIAEIVSGMTTGNNDIFLKLWFEVEFPCISFNELNISNVNLSVTKWIPYNKGGEQRKWYGNNEYVVDWSQSAKFNRAKTTMKHLYLQPCITWSDISGTSFAGRYCNGGFMFDVKGSCGFSKDGKSLYRLIATLNSVITPLYIEALNPTTTTQVGDLNRIPLCSGYFQYSEIIENLVINCIQLSKTDWDSFETSWDFKRHPFIEYMVEAEREEPFVNFNGISAFSDSRVVTYHSIENAFLNWQRVCEERFNKLKANEEELNRIFIEIYGLQDELTPEVEDRDVTVRKADLQRDMRSFVSYAVGCMFGRYSLDVEGLAYAGGEWDSTKYRSFIPDAENCLPITEEPFFEDDIVTQFAKFVETVYGSDTLEENLRFVAENLGIKGNGTAREKIRQYFLKEFFKDHCKIYQKRPIYWLFDTGKKNGFKALCYLHRWDVNTVGNVRIDYMHKLQRLYRNEIIRLRENIDKHEDVARSEKRLEKIISQLQETEEYDAKIGIVVAARIEIDLDDGVKVNYDRVQTGSDGKKYQILATI